jgi:hypothetical protein
MTRPYARIKLTPTDRDYLLDQLRAIASQLQESLGQSSTDDEKAFYRDGLNALEDLTERLVAHRSTAFGVTEKELRWLCAPFAYQRTALLINACLAAKQVDPALAATLSQELADRDRLYAVLQRPYVLDTSTDPLDEEEDDEEYQDEAMTI